MEKKRTSKPVSSKPMAPTPTMMGENSYYNGYQGGCGSGHCGHHHHGGMGGFFKFIVFLIVVGLFIGAFSHMQRWSKFNYMRGFVGNGTEVGMMTYWDNDDQVFGTITVIAGNVITIRDNAGELQTFESQAETMIMNSTMPIGLSALKVGDNVLIKSKGNRDKKDRDDEVAVDPAAAPVAVPVEHMEAKMIRVVEAPAVVVAPKK